MDLPFNFHYNGANDKKKKQGMHHQSLDAGVGYPRKKCRKMNDEQYECARCQTRCAHQGSRYQHEKLQTYESNFWKIEPESHRKAETDVGLTSLALLHT